MSADIGQWKRVADFFPLERKGISVLQLKLYRNAIGDVPSSSSGGCRSNQAKPLPLGVDHACKDLFAVDSSSLLVLA